MRVKGYGQHKRFEGVGCSNLGCSFFGHGVVGMVWLVWYFLIWGRYLHHRGSTEIDHYDLVSSPTPSLGLGLVLNGTDHFFIRTQ